MTHYQNKEGEPLDEICSRFYGSTYGKQVEAVLEANRAMRLADYSPSLPAGLIITLPEVTPSTKETVRLFS